MQVQIVFIFFRILHVHFLNQIIMKKTVSFLLLGLAFAFVSCDDVVDSVDVKEDVSMPPMEFTVEREGQKDGDPDTLMDEKMLLNLDSVLAAIDYGSMDLVKSLNLMSVKRLFFQLKDTTYAKSFDFIDNARLTFSTPNTAEETIAHLMPKSERPAKTYLELYIDASDVTKYMLSKDSVRVRIYGNIDMDAIPAEISELDVEVGGLMGMELKPKIK